VNADYFLTEKARRSEYGGIEKAGDGDATEVLDTSKMPG
jgi:hypothetical protein